LYPPARGEVDQECDAERHGRVASRAVRVLGVGNLYPPHDQGGGYEAVWHGANEALRANGHEVRVLTTDHLVAGREDRPGADVHRELRWYWEDHEFPKRPLRDVVALERHNAAVLRQHLDRVDLVAW
jgi:glycogen synthase